MCDTKEVDLTFFDPELKMIALKNGRVRTFKFDSSMNTSSCDKMIDFINAKRGVLMTSKEIANKFRIVRESDEDTPLFVYFLDNKRDVHITKSFRFGTPRNSTLFDFLVQKPTKPWTRYIVGAAVAAAASFLIWKTLTNKFQRNEMLIQQLEAEIKHFEGRIKESDELKKKLENAQKNGITIATDLFAMTLDPTKNKLMSLEFHNNFYQYLRLKYPAIDFSLLTLEVSAYSKEKKVEFKKIEKWPRTRYVCGMILITLNEAKLGHANAYFVDNELKTIFLFEPRGKDELIHTFGTGLNQIAPETKNYTYNPNRVSFQINEDVDLKIDPVGYCLAWSLWFLDYRLKFIDFEIEGLISEANEQLRDNFNKQIEFIRYYAAMMTKLQAIKEEDYKKVHHFKDIF